MEYKKTEHETNSKDYEDKFELKESVDQIKFFLEEKVKFEAYDFYEDNKYVLKNKRTIQSNHADDSKDIFEDEYIKTTGKFKIEVALKSSLLKITKTLVGKNKFEKQKDGEENDDNNDLNCTHSTVSEDDASYANHPSIEELRNNTEEKRYICVHCGYSSSKRQGLVEHLLSHSDERPFACAHCSYQTVKKKNLRKHIKTMHLRSIDAATTDRAKPFQCVSCDASYKNQYSLIRHIQRHNNESVATDKQNILSCSICNFSSLNPYVLKTHAFTHSLKSFKCEECQIFYSRNDVLKRHLLNFHTPEILYECKPCDRKFHTESSLLRHKQSCTGTGKSRTSAPRLKCTICAKAFAYKSVLDRHRLTHTKQYPFKCSICAQSFPTYTLLRYHIYSHSKESLFKCSVCNFSTDHQTTMKTHEANHKKHNLYNCTDCNYLTTKCNLFMKHCEEHNYGKGKFQCAQCSYSTDTRHCIIKHLKLHSV